MVTTLAAIVAISRVYPGTHYLSDTIAGVSIGIVASLATGWLLEHVDMVSLSR